MLGAIDNSIRPDHHTKIYLNGIEVEDAKWDGLVWRVAEIQFPQSFLRQGDNPVSVVSENDTGVGFDLVMFIFGVIEVLIGIRFVLKLLGANSEAAFVKLVYGVSNVFVSPFNSIFGTQRVSGATFEWSALVAIAIYALIAWGIVALVRAVSPREHAQTVERVETGQNVRADENTKTH